MSREGPFFHFYPSDWLAGTRGMSAAETGVYITLIAMMYERGEPLAFPRVKLARLCGTTQAAFDTILAGLVSDEKIIELPEGLAAPILDAWDGPRRRPPIPAAIARLVMSRDGRACSYCGSTDGPFHMDHIVPWSRGGEHNENNLCISCASCNLSKGAKTLDEWEGPPQ